MNKKTLPLLIFLLSFYAVSSQTPSSKAVAFFRSGLDLKAKNMMPAALEAFNKAISLNKKYDSAYVEIGLLYIGSGNYDGAILNFSKAVAINPTMTSAYLALGNVYRNSKSNFDSSLFFFLKAYRTDSSNKLTLINIAWCYNSLKDYDNAIIYGIKALDIDNTYKAAYNEMGHAYHFSKKYKEGLEQFKKNIAISVVDLPLFYCGMIYTELNDKQGALTQYEELKKINEKSAAALKRVIDKMQ